MISGPRVLTGCALASATAMLVIVIWTADRDAPAPAEPPIGDVVRVGVVEGQSVPGYLVSSRGELDRMVPGGRTWALVTLSGYLPPRRLPSVLGSGAVAQVYARAPLKDAATRVVRIPAQRVPEDVEAGLQAAATDRDRERADYGRLSRDVLGDGHAELRLRRAYEDAASAAAAEADAYRAQCACVFAAVVHADPATLRGIAGRAEVRAVDPAPEVRRLDRVEFRPPLPEQQPGTPTATAPAQRGTSSVAPAAPSPLPSSLGATVTSASPQRPATPTAGPGPSLPASEEHPAATPPT